MRSAYELIPTPLQAAAQTGSPEIARLLLDGNADPNRRYTGGETALYYAAQAGRIDVVSALLDAGADPALIGPEGTPADIATRAGYKEIAQLLAQ